MMTWIQQVAQEYILSRQLGAYAEIIWPHEGPIIIILLNNLFLPIARKWISVIKVSTATLTELEGEKFQSIK